MHYKISIKLVVALGFYKLLPISVWTMISSESKKSEKIIYFIIKYIKKLHIFVTQLGSLILEENWQVNKKHTKENHVPH